MIIELSYPPNIDEIDALLHVKGKSIVYTYGDTIYNPLGKEMSLDLITHECVHSKQQTNPQEWWEKYLSDTVFRFEQELEAYRIQYQFFKRRTKDREKIARFLHRIASDLSGEMYGKIISHAEAMKQIKDEV